MFRIRHSIAFLLLAACGAPPPTSVDVAAAHTVGEATYFAIAPGTACPSAVPGQDGSWATQALPAPLDGFCRLRWTSQTAVADPDEDALEFNGFQAAAVDERVVYTMAGVAADGAHGLLGLTGSLKPALDEAFEYQIARIEPLAGFSPDAVRIAIVDTDPDAASQPNSKHADTLRSVADGIICGRDGCVAHVQKHLGLPRTVGGQMDRINGGYYGTATDLATGIIEAVNAANGRRLIVNLSVGWDGQRLSGDLPANAIKIVGRTSTIPAPSQAVFLAVAYASCHGAIVIAASGNDPVGTGDQAPLLPGAWGRIPAPTPEECSNAFNIHDAPEVLPDTPLVYAVSGFGHDGDDVANARVNGRASLLAPSEAVPSNRNDVVMTGSSVAAAVASAVAANAWAIASTSSSHEVMRLVRAGGQRTDMPTDFCASPDCAPATKVSMCGAIAAACSATGGCDVICEAKAPRVKALSHDAFMNAVAEYATNTPLLVADFGTKTTTVGACEGVRLHEEIKTGGCPLDTPRRATDALDYGPQPLDPICPACPLVEVGGFLFVALSMSPTVPTGRVYDPMITVENIIGRRDRFFLGTSLPARSQTLIRLGRQTSFLRIRKAWLTYRYSWFGYNFVAAEPLIVSQR